MNLSASTSISLFLSLSPCESAPFPPSRLLPDYSFNRLSSCVSDRAIYCDSARCDSPSLQSFHLTRIVSSSLRKQFIRLFVFRFSVSRGLLRFRRFLWPLPPCNSSHSSPIPLFCLFAVAVTFEQQLAHTSKLFSDSTFVEHTGTPSAARICLLPSLSLLILLLSTPCVIASQISYLRRYVFTIYCTVFSYFCCLICWLLSLPRLTFFC